jgi:hypothetical protein
LFGQRGRASAGKLHGGLQLLLDGLMHAGYFFRGERP